MTVIEALDASMNILNNMVIPGHQAHMMAKVLELLQGSKAALIEPEKKEDENESA